MSKNIFIDCGTHCFEGFEDFAKRYSIDSLWECYCFEANPFTYTQSQVKYQELIKRNFNITYKQEAVSTINSEIKINCAYAGEDGYTNQGSNILNQPPSVDIQYGGTFNYTSEQITTPTIDFAEFLFKIAKIEDRVIIKMDIEGSEFSVIDHLIAQNNLNLIDEIYIEFHERFFKDINTYINKKHNYKQVFIDNNIKFFEWY
jgi:FkbM family methyltransferase